MTKTHGTLATLLAAALALAGTFSCGDDDDDGSPQNTSLSDAQVLGVLATANQGEVSFSQRGIDNGRDAQVKTFSRDMVDMHTMALAHVQTVASSTDLGTADSNVSASLKSSEKDAETKVDAQTAPSLEYDLYFMCAQVRLHRGVLKTIDESLVPSAKRQEVSTEVTSTRPVVAQHLQMAEDIVLKLGASSPGSNDDGGVGGDNDGGVGGNNDGGVGGTNDGGVGGNDDGGVGGNNDGGVGQDAGTAARTVEQICSDRGGAS
jgi:putative membrane protein